MHLAALFATVSPEPTQAASGKSTDPVICHRDESEVGTHMRPKPVCMRKSEWDLVEKDTQRQLQSLHDKHTDPGRADGHGPH